MTSAAVSGSAARPDRPSVRGIETHGVGMFTVHVGRLSTPPDGFRTERLMERLPASEQRRITRLRRSDDRCRSLMGFYLLEHAVECEGDSILWESFTRNAHGRPAVERLCTGSNWDFSISHSADVVVCAIGSARLGIDVEQIAHVDIADFQSVMPVDLYPRILRSENPMGEFYRWWTRVESALKAEGCGFGEDIARLRFESDEVLTPLHSYHCHDLDFIQGYACCLAAAASCSQGVRE